MDSKREITLKKCYQAFMDRDYDSCISHMVEIGLMAGRMWTIILLYCPEVVQIRQMYTICQQRLGMESMARLDAISIFRAEPTSWLAKVVNMTIKEATMADVLKAAKNQVEICQTYYYAGERMATDSDWAQALNLFKKCLTYQDKCIEKEFAKSRIAWLETKVK